LVGWGCNGAGGSPRTVKLLKCPSIPYCRHLPGRVSWGWLSKSRPKILRRVSIHILSNILFKSRHFKPWSLGSERRGTMKMGHSPEAWNSGRTSLGLETSLKDYNSELRVCWDTAPGQWPPPAQLTNLAGGGHLSLVAFFLRKSFLFTESG
jgi:hypothetical protein